MVLTDSWNTYPHIERTQETETETPLGRVQIVEVVECICFSMQRVGKGGSGCWMSMAMDLGEIYPVCYPVFFFLDAPFRLVVLFSPPVFGTESAISSDKLEDFLVLHTHCRNFGRTPRFSAAARAC